MADEAKKSQLAGATVVEEGDALLGRILSEGRLARDESGRSQAKQMLSQFMEQVLDKDVKFDRNTSRMINERIAAIDELMSAQLNKILHDSKFQKLEASWRNLHKLATTAELGSNLKLRVLNVSTKELASDFQKAAGFDQSNLFKKVYEREYGTLGGEPYGILTGDFEIGRNPGDIDLLRNLSEVAAAASAPLVASAAPSLFDLESFEELDRPYDLRRIFESSTMAKWQSFRASEESRFVALTLPRVLTRLPYGPDTSAVEGFDYVEDVDGTDHSKYLWGTASWSLTLRMMDSFSQYGWSSSIRGVESGGKVGNLPLHTFRSKTGEMAAKCPTEIQITDRREKELADLGFISLCHARNTDYAVFFSGATTNQPRKYVDEDANSNARLSATLPYIMAASRFAHYLKVIIRDKVGGFESQATLHQYLNEWISQYVTQDDSASAAVKARYPLREARVDVMEIPGKPGAYNAVVYLRPHYQLEEMTASLRLVANLPKAAG